MNRPNRAISDHVPGLSCWSFANAAEWQATIEDLSSKDVELLPIRTCQRLELYVIAAEPIRMRAAAQLVAEHSDAAARLFQFAAGALSAIPGERAVASQLNEAVRSASHLGLIGPLLRRLTMRAGEAATSIRKRVEQTTSILELSDLVADILRQLMLQQTAPSGSPRIALFGAGPVAKSVHAALAEMGVGVSNWATRRPHAHAGVELSIERALPSLSDCDVLITAIADAPDMLDAAVLPKNLVAIDLGVPGNIRGATWSLASIIDQAQDRLRPQREAIERAAHRIPALAEAALAETLSPSIAHVTESITRFRASIVGAELKRLEALLSTLPAEQAEPLRRAIAHTAARCLHPLHEYVNMLGRQGRADQAATVVDHLLGGRVGWCDVAAIDSHSAAPA